MKSIEATIESLIMAARWLLVVFYGGLGLALVDLRGLVRPQVPGGGAAASSNSARTR